MTQQNAKDPLDFVRGMWSNMGFSLPGMVAPTLDIDELDKRVTDMKAVENWLKMNLSMLQMTIQGLEMQRAALAAVRAMSQQSEQGNEEANPDSNPFAQAAAMWPWNFMSGQGGETGSVPEGNSTEDTSKPRSRSRKTPPAADK